MTTPNPEASPLRQLARIAVGYVFIHACLAGVRLASPLLALRSGHSEAAVGVLMALYALTQVFLALPAGRFADREGIRKPMMLSLTVASLGAALAFAWPVFPVLCLAALMTGGATGAASIAMQRHVGRVAETPTQLKQVFSWMAIAPATANFVGPLAAGLVIDHAGFRAAFLSMALLPLITLVCLRGLQEPPRPAATPPRKGQRAWDLWREPSLRRLLLVNWLISACWDVHTFVLPVLGHARGLSASVIGIILGAFAIAAAGVRVLLPVIAARLREWAVITGVMLSTAAIFVVYPLMPNAWAMGACSVLLGIALGSVQPMVMSMLHQITPHDRHGEAIAMRSMVVNASSVAMPVLFGLAGTLVGVSSVFWTVGIAVGAGARLAAGLRGALRDDRTS